MKKIVVLTGVLLLSSFAFGQQADKFAMLGKAGFSMSLPADAFCSNLLFEYMLSKHMGIVAGFGQIYGNNFPNKSGRISTGSLVKEENSSNHNCNGDLCNYIHNKIFTENTTVMYDTYSAFSFNFGVVLHLLSNDNNIIALTAGGDYLWQNSEQFAVKEKDSEEALLETIYEHFTGMGFLGDVTYRRRVYKSFWAGAYLQISPFSAEYSSHNSSVGAELSVRF